MKKFILILLSYILYVPFASAAVNDTVTTYRITVGASVGVIALLIGIYYIIWRNSQTAIIRNKARRNAEKLLKKAS
ncbi:MAG: hypothetical protein ACK40G_02210 [Cytophagaceae bacterium]